MTLKQKEQIDKETDEERNKEFYEPLDSAFLDFVESNKDSLLEEFLFIYQEEYLEYCKDEFRRTL